MSSLLGLLLLLGAVALVGLRPWATSAVAPDLSVAPGIGVAMGDSSVVAGAPSPRVSTGSPAVGTGGIGAPASPEAVSAPVVTSTPGQPDAQPTLAVSPARPLQGSPAVPPPAAAGPAPAPEPVAAPPSPLAPPAPAQPVVAAVQGGDGQGTSGGPISSGVGSGQPEQSCEGDEYLITVSFEEADDEEAEDGEDGGVEADILVQSLGTDGGETEVQLRGDLDDVRDLVATLVSEGNCVEVDVRPLPEGDASDDASNSGVETTEPGDVPESLLP